MKSVDAVRCVRRSTSRPSVHAPNATRRDAGFGKNAGGARVRCRVQRCFACDFLRGACPKKKNEERVGERLSALESEERDRRGFL